jgi:hypothetical protein
MLDRFKKHSLLVQNILGTVKIWDVRQKEKPVVVIEPEDGDQKRDCWTVTFGKTEFVKYQRM